MFWITKRRFKVAMEKIKQHIAELVSQSLNSRVLIEKNRKDIVSRKEIDLIIENKILKQGAKVKDRPVQVALPMKLKKGYKKKQIIEEMQNLNNQGYSVTEIEQAIVNKFGISRRTFYNYKKKLIVKVHLH